MSLTDVVRNVAKSVRGALSDREKAKELPLHVLQSALSGVGQALLLGDRVRARLKRLSGREEEAKRPSVDEQLAEGARKATEEAAPAGDTDEGGARTARREPVIFAPRPARSEEPRAKEAVQPDTARAAKAETAEAAAEESTEPVAKPTETIAESAAETPVKGEAEAPVMSETEQRSPEAVTEPVAEAKGATATEAAAEPVAAAPAGDTPPLAEPIPGYADLTLASLRARLRNKTADEIRALIAYEKATANRDNIIKMYENRLAKITAGK